MRWVLLIFLLLLAPASAETPANDIQVPGPDGFVLHPVLSDADPKAGGSCSLVRIDISRHGHLVQTLHPKPNSPPLDPEHPRDMSHCIRCDDCNFDGHPDIVFVDSVGSLANCSNQVWLYDPQAERFVWSSVLSDMANLEVDARQHRLTTGGRSEAGLEAEYETYAWQKGGLVLVEDMHQEPISPNWTDPPVKVRAVVRKRVNGRMQVADVKVFVMDNGGEQKTITHRSY